MSDPLSYERLAVIARTLNERKTKGPLRDVLQAISGAGLAMVTEAEALARIREIVRDPNRLTWHNCDIRDIETLEHIIDAKVPSALTEDWAAGERLVALVDVAHALYRLRSKPFDQ